MRAGVGASWDGESRSPPSSAARCDAGPPCGRRPHPRRVGVEGDPGPQTRPGGVAHGTQGRQPTDGESGQSPTNSGTRFFLPNPGPRPCRSLTPRRHRPPSSHPLDPGPPGRLPGLPRLFQLPGLHPGARGGAAGRGEKRRERRWRERGLGGGGVSGRASAPVACACVFSPPPPCLPPPRPSRGSLARLSTASRRRRGAGAVRVTGRPGPGVPARSEVARAWALGDRAQPHEGESSCASVLEACMERRAEHRPCAIPGESARWMGRPAGRKQGSMRRLLAQRQLPLFFPDPLTPSALAPSPPLSLRSARAPASS